MDIGSMRMVKETLVEAKQTKQTSNKQTTTIDNKQGCIKLNDYLAF